VSFIAANPRLLLAALLPQPAGDPRAERVQAQMQPTPGFLVSGDPERNVFFAEPGSQVSHVTQLTLGTLTAPPAIFNGYAYAGEGNTTAGSLLHAWSLTTAADAWSNVTIPASVDATPVIQAATMYVAAANGFLYAYDIATVDRSTSLWQLDVMRLTGGAKVKTTALVLAASGNAIYLVSAGGIWAVDLRLRSVLWSAAATISFTQAAPLYDGRLLLASGGSSLYCIDTLATASSGVMQPKWTFNAGSTCSGPMSIARTFAVIDATGKLHAVDRDTGRETASLADVLPASAAGKCALYEDVILAANTGGDLYARRIVVSGGALKKVELWRVATPAPINSAPIAFGGNVYVAPMGRLQAYRLSDAALVWGISAPSNISRLGALGLGLRVPQAPGKVKFLLDGPEFFLTLRNLLLAAAAGTFETTTPPATLTAGELLTNIGAAGGNSYLMLWDTTDTKQFLRANYLGPLLDLARKVDTRQNLLSVRSLEGKTGVQAILVPYKAYDSWQPLYSQHQKIGIVSVGGTKLAFVGGFNLDLPLYWDETTHPMLNESDGKKNYTTWHDSALLVQGAAADLVEQHYDRIWKSTGRTLVAPGTGNYAKLAFWAGKAESCVDKYESCSGQVPPTPYVNPSLSGTDVGVDLLITNAETSVRVTDVRARLVQKIMTATSYVYLENYAVNDIQLIRAITGKLRNAPVGFQIILMTPHPTKDDEGDEQVAENILTKMGYAAIFLDTQQWTSFTTTSGETIVRANISNFTVILDDRGPEFGTLSFTSGGTRTLSLSQIRDIAAPSDVRPSILFCSGARYIANPQPGDEKYELTGGVLSTHFRKVYIHSKLALFDDLTAIIGSANLTERSLYRDGETNLCVTDATAVAAMRDKLFRHWGQTTAAQWYVTMNAFASATAPALGVVPLTFAALPNDWPNWMWAWAAAITGMSDYI
jgi:phosphatidylserine/phosphatidylglycerophosphate/cardiolipin synthase-like enzyme